MPRLLVIEDEVVVGIYLREELQDAGFEVVLVTDGQSALQALSKETFDGAIVDVGLPDISGIEIARRCREQNPQFPFIFATGVDSAALGDQLQDCNACWLPKPYEVGALMNCLEELRLVKPTAN